MENNHESFAAARFIREIGRGTKGARSISREDARALYGAMLDGRVSDLEVGALLLAMRIKGESVDEISGFMEAAEASFAPLAVPPADYAPLVIPSYNGSRKMANLTPLLAMLLARQGVPVLVHGVRSDPGRVTTAEIFAELGIGPAQSGDDVAAAAARGLPSFMPIETLAPKLAHMLSLRRILGVRNSTHTLVKLLQPFAGPALRLVSYTHPEYLQMLGEYFGTAAAADRGDVFLMRGTEGEPVANATRGRQIVWFHGRERSVLAESDAPNDDAVALPEASDAASTAAWITRVLKGEVPVPGPIAAQATHCLAVCRALQTGEPVAG
ncbi:MAG TPA: DNA-binding protein YbiB [Telluria sp.]